MCCLSYTENLSNITKPAVCYIVRLCNLLDTFTHSKKPTFSIVVVKDSSKTLKTGGQVPVCQSK
jgi:hypothetical protein